jgi:hypothetical protein
MGLVQMDIVVCGQNSGVQAQSNGRQFLLQFPDTNFA